MRQLKITHQITNRDSNTIEKYFNEISKEELLTPPGGVGNVPAGLNRVIS